MKNLIATILLAVTLVASPAGLLAGITGTLSGYVKDKSDQPLPGVNVILEGTTMGAATDVTGYYQINNIPSGKYTVLFSIIGYSRLEVNEVQIKSDLRTKLNAQLAEQAIEGEEVVITADKSLIQNDVTATQYTITGVEIEQLPIKNLDEAITYKPGITYDGHIRGGRLDEVLYLVDGVSIKESLTGEKGLIVPKNSVTELTVQTGGFNAEYGRALSGIINVVTDNGSNERKISSSFSTDAFGDVRISDGLNGQETDKLYKGEFFIKGPFVRDRIFYMTSLTYQRSNTRWWQYYQNPQNPLNQLDGPIEESFNGMVKLNFRPTHDKRIAIQTLFTRKEDRDFNFRWIPNLRGNYARNITGIRTMLSFNHTTSDKTFYNLILSHFHSRRKLNNGPRDELDADSDKFIYDTRFQFIAFGKDLRWIRTNQDVFLAKFDITSQVKEKHILKIGGEIQYYQIDQDQIEFAPRTDDQGYPLRINHAGIDVFSRSNYDLLDFTTKYRYEPVEGNFFVQDKFEVDRFVMNLGLRYDFLHPRADRPIVELDTDSVRFVGASVKQQFSPRLGLAFPIGDEGYVFMNYGWFFQVPLFEYLYTGTDFDTKQDIGSLVGDPDLRPEKTEAFEISYKHIFGRDILGSMTYFRKETQDLVGTNTLNPSDSKLSEKNTNRFVTIDNALVNGIEFYVEKEHTRQFSGSFSYSYMIARGSSSGARESFNFENFGYKVTKFEYDLDWDQRHTFAAQVYVSTEKKDLGVTVSWRANSARPYTFVAAFDSLRQAFGSRTGTVNNRALTDVPVVPNNRRLGFISYVDVKAKKTFFVNKYGMKVSVYAQVNNLLDRKNIRWKSSDGLVGGELGDPSARDIGRRVEVGVQLEL